MVHMFPSNIHNIEYVCGLEVLGVQLIYPAMFEHDVPYIMDIRWKYMHLLSHLFHGLQTQFPHT